MTETTIVFYLSKMRNGISGRSWDSWRYELKEVSTGNVYTCSELEEQARIVAERYPTEPLMIHSVNSGELNPGASGSVWSCGFATRQAARASDEDLGKLIDLIDKERLKVSRGERE